MLPTATSLNQDLPFTEDGVGAVVFDQIVVADSDPGETITATLTAPVGSGALSTTGAATFDPATGVWRIVGTVTEVNAALAAVAFTPAADVSGEVEITVQIRDAAETGPDGVITLTGDPVNDAPTLSGGPLSLTATTEDANSDPVSVADLLAGLSHGDVDAGALSGIAIVGETGNAGWEYSTDGTTWAGVGAVSGGSALLLSGATLLRYNPDSETGETATLTFRAWDQTSGTASTNSVRNTADTGVNGNDSAFSSGTAEASLEVTDVNDAPDLLTAGSPTLPTVSENGEPPEDGDTSGSVLVSSLLTGATDIDGDDIGMAIQGITASGTLWYSLDDGDTWVEAPAVSLTAALLLPPDARLYFQAHEDTEGAVSAALTFRAWDGTIGAAGEQRSVQLFHPTVSHSADTDTVSVTISAGNSPPHITAPATIAVDGETIITGLSFADSDAGSDDVTVTLSVPAGALSAASGAGVVVGGTPQALTLTGSIADINDFLEDQSVGYTPPGSASGDVTLTVTIDDLGNNGPGGAQQATDTVVLDLPTPPPADPEPEPEAPPPQYATLPGGLQVAINTTTTANEVKQISAQLPGNTAGVSFTTSAIMGPTNGGLGSPTINLQNTAPATVIVFDKPQPLLTLPTNLTALNLKIIIPNIFNTALGASTGGSELEQIVVRVGPNGSGTSPGRLGITGGTGSVKTVAAIDTGSSSPETMNISLDNVHGAIIIGGATITGGAGPQTVIADGARQKIILGEDDDALYAGGGDDTVGSATGNDTLAGDEGNDVVFGGEGGDNLTGGADNDHLHGNVGDDWLHGNQGNDTVHGGQGDDVARGGQGADILSGDMGQDILFGDLGDDIVLGGDGSDWAHGGQGRDTVLGGAGDDILQGGQGDDVLEGGDGNDTLLGDAGDDVVTGGAGADVFAVFAGGGADRIVDFSFADGDRLRLDAGATYTAEQVGADTVVSVGGAKMTLAGVQLASLGDGWILAG